MFSFDNSDQQFWRYMPDDESDPECRDIVRGYVPEHIGEERILLYGH